jgi:hypothetical protein
MEHKYKTAVAKGVRLALIAAAVTLINPNALVNAQTGGAEKAPMPPIAMNVAPEVTGVNHVLKATYIHTCLPSCTSFTVGAETAVPLDAVTKINCPAPIGKTCTITDDAWIELENTSSSANPEALGFYVDGNDADFLFNGGAGTPGGGQYDGLAHKTAVATGVSRGTHTVQTLTYSVFGANAAGWTATYRVYVP